MKNDYEIRGDVTAILIKSKDRCMETVIDTCDLIIVKSIPVRWFAHWNPLAQKYYVSATQYLGDYKQRTIKLHRVLMGANSGELIDHINHNPLDNRRTINLRRATNSQNQQNREGSAKHSKSGVRGVYFHKLTGKWAGQIRVNKKAKHLGLFDSIQEAEDEVKKARKKYMPYSRN